MRINHLLDALKTQEVDVALLQEIKCQDENFPYLEIEELGYNVKIKGQKTFNGVAIITKHPIEEIITELPSPDGEVDEQARYIESVITVSGKVFRIISVYVPNGNEVGSEKHQYKFNFYKRLTKHVKTLLEYDEHLIIGGDFNVANLDIDVYDIPSFEGKICFEINERKALREFINLGLFDAHRILNPTEQDFTWWDYRGGAYSYNKGLKIDYFFNNAKAMDLVTSYQVLNQYRALEKPSDHAPLLLELSLQPN